MTMREELEDAADKLRASIRAREAKAVAEAAQRKAEAAERVRVRLQEEQQKEEDAAHLQQAMRESFAQGRPFLTADPGDENVTKEFHAPADLTDRPTQPPQIVLTPVDLGQLRSMMAKWERRAPLFDSSTGAIITEILADVRSVIK